MSLITLALLSWKPLLTSVVRNSQMTAQEVEWNTSFVGCTNERQTSKLFKALRWSLFKENQAKPERLTPRQAALHQAILRVHYQLLVCNSDRVANLVLLSPEGFGWQDEDGKWVQVMINLPPAPKAIIQLVRCKCAKYCCSNNRC